MLGILLYDGPLTDHINPRPKSIPPETVLPAVYFENPKRKINAKNSPKTTADKWQNSGGKKGATLVPRDYPRMQIRYGLICRSTQRPTKAETKTGVAVDAGGTILLSFPPPS